MLTVEKQHLLVYILFLFIIKSIITECSLIQTSRTGWTNKAYHNWTTVRSVSVSSQKISHSKTRRRNTAPWSTSEVWVMLCFILYGLLNHLPGWAEGFCVPYPLWGHMTHQSVTPAPDGWLLLQAQIQADRAPCFQWVGPIYLSVSVNLLSLWT